jgi:hypothetical protein
MERIIMSDEEPTLEQMRQFWKEHRDAEKLKEMNRIVNENPQAQIQNPATQNRPIDPITHLPLTFEQMKQRFMTLQGRSKGWQVADDNIDHDINTPRPSEGKPSQSYEELRAEFFARQGKQDPLKKTAAWKDRLEKDQQKYGRV